MALGSTVYKATLDISDLDRGYYATHVLTVARHPSETEERLMLRILAFASLAGEHLEFGRGLSTEGEPALWEIDDTGTIERWIEVGCPDVRQVRRAAGRSNHVTVLAYGEDRVGPWWQSVSGDFSKIDKLAVHARDEGVSRQPFADAFRYVDDLFSLFGFIVFVITDIVLLDTKE